MSKQKGITMFRYEALNKAEELLIKASVDDKTPEEMKELRELAKAWKELAEKLPSPVIPIGMIW